MHFHWNLSSLEGNVVSQRVVYVVYVVVLSLQQERRRRLAGDGNFGIQCEIFVSGRGMRNQKLFGALLRIPFCRGKREVTGINRHCKVRAAAFFVGGIDSGVQTLREM